MQLLEMCLRGAILMLMKADTVSTSSASQQQTLTRPVRLRSRFLRQQPVSFTSTKIIKEQREVAHTNPIKHLQPASIITHHQRAAAKLLVVIFFNPCLSNLTIRLVHHHTFTLLPRPQRLAPLSLRSRGPGGHHNGALKSND